MKIRLRRAPKTGAGAGVGGGETRCRGSSKTRAQRVTYPGPGPDSRPGFPASQAFRALMVRGTGVNRITGNFEIKVEKLVYGGDGLARLDGRVVFAPFVLPGERIRAAAEREKPGLVRARTLEVLEARAGARRRRLRILRPLRRMPLSARSLRVSACRQARHPRRRTAPPGQDRAARPNRSGLGRAVGLPQPGAVAHRGQPSRLP